MSLAARLRSVRSGRTGDLALLVAVGGGLAASTLHWGGLVLGGLLVGLVAPSFRRAVLHGLYFGGTVLVAFGLYLWLLGGLGAYAAMGQVFFLSVAIGLLVPPLAAGAARGLT